MSCRTFNRSGKKDPKKPSIGYRALQKMAHKMIEEKPQEYLDKLEELFLRYNRINAALKLFDLAKEAEIEEPEKPRRMHILDFWASEPEWTPEWQREKDEREKKEKEQREQEEKEQQKAEQQKQQEAEQQRQQELAQQQHQAEQQTEPQEPAASNNTENQNHNLAAEIGLPGTNTIGLRRCNGETHNGPSSTEVATNESNPPGATIQA